MSIKCMVWAWGLNLPAPVKLVLLALADHADDQGVCWPGIRGVANKCNLSHRSVQRHVQDMVARGMVRVEERFRADGSRSSNLYRLSVGGGMESPGGVRPTVGVVTESHLPVTSASPLEPSFKTSIETSGEKDSPAVRKRTSGAITTETWEAYSQAYQRRYGTDPVRNQKVNSQLANLVQRLGQEEAPAVAAFFVNHNGRFYMQGMHQVSLLLRDAEKLRTEWFTGQMTANRYPQGYCAQPPVEPGRAGHGDVVPTPARPTVVRL